MGFAGLKNLSISDNPQARTRGGPAERSDIISLEKIKYRLLDVRCQSRDGGGTVARPDCVHRPWTLYERNPVGFWQGVAALLVCALLLSLLLR
jgi:hypothetical protein